MLLEVVRRGERAREGVDGVGGEGKGMGSSEPWTGTRGGPCEREGQWAERKGSERVG